MYKFEIHIHTNTCSKCAVTTPEDMVDAAVTAGYSGIVVTNHFYHGNTCIDRDLPWADFVGAYRDDYLRAKARGDEKGLQVFFGIEEGWDAGKEMLIYGVTPEQLIAEPDFIKMNVEQKCDFVHRCGGACVCAHPFRVRDYIPNPDTPPNPDLFDCIEGYNAGNPHADNLKAFVFSYNKNKVVTSGGDIHSASLEHFSRSGIDFDTPIKDYSDFVNRLKVGDFKILTPYEER